MSSIWTCAKHLTLSHTTSLTPSWRDMDLLEGPLGALGIGWMVTLKELLNVQMETSDEWRSSGVGIETDAV